MRRPRGPGGRFLTAAERAALERGEYIPGVTGVDGKLLDPMPNIKKSHTSSGVTPVKVQVDNSSNAGEGAIAA